MSGNPGGKPKVDLAAQIARAIFENEGPEIYNGFAKQLRKGSPYAFQVLSDRAYGKLKERHEYELAPYRDTPEADIHDRIREIESRLGYAASQGIPRQLNPGTPGSAGGTEAALQRTEPQILPPEEP